MKETMNPETNQPKIAKERHMPGAEATELGLEIGNYLKAVEDLRHFELTLEWQKYLPYANEAESEPKAEAKEAAKTRLQEIMKEIGNLSKSTEKLAKLWESELEK